MSSLISFLVGMVIGLFAEKNVEHLEKHMAIGGGGLIISLIGFLTSLDGKTIYTEIIFSIGTCVVGYGLINLLIIWKKATALSEEVVVEPPPKKVEEPDYSVPVETRCSHQLILGSSGHGKTQLIAEQVAGDLTRPCSVVVFDSQGDLLNRILKVDHPRVVLIDPTDIEYPISLGLFDFKTEGVTAYDREKNLNSVIELLSFVLNSLLSSQLTSKQDVALRYAIRLCMVIPDANILTLRDIFGVKFKEYARYTEKLSDTAKEFFETEFQSKQFQETREQILRRIYSILENQTLERIFKNSKSKLDMKRILDEGSVVLINSAKSLLKEEGSKFFSRFMVALIAQATQERTPGKEIPVYVYIDEAAPIIDENITNLLETARKYRVGLVLAFQSLGQIPYDLQHSIITNTAIKCLGGISAKDARALQDDVQTKADDLMSIPKLSFLFSVKNRFTRVHRVTLSVLEKMPRRASVKKLIEENRAKYCETQKKSVLPPDDIEAYNKA
jgi:hypothetical protein